MTESAILGGAALCPWPLPALDSSSALGLEVARWADRPARLARMDRLCALALVACDAALVDASLSPGDAAWSPERTGVVLGTAFGCHATNEAYYRGYLADAAAVSPRLFAYTLPSSPVGEITIHHRILGPASTLVGGLVAAIDALREAQRHLDASRADRILVAAADVSTPTLAKLGAPATRDAAAALVLARDEDRGDRRGLRITGTATRFYADAPLAAARACLESLRMHGFTTAQLHAPAALLPALAAETPGASLHALDERALSAAPLIALRSLEGVTSALIVATDPSGQAGALRVERR